MTIADLDHLQELQKKLKRTQATLEHLRDRAKLQGVSLDGMPHGSGVRDRVGESVAGIVDAETKLKELEAEYERQRALVSNWIDQETDDLKAALIMTERFLNGAQWETIDREICACEGVAASGSVARRYLQRYLKRHLNEDESNGCESSR